VLLSTGCKKVGNKHETETEKTTWGVAGFARMSQEGGVPPPKKEEVALAPVLEVSWRRVLP
jgi:hypothetical protein